MVKVKLGHRLGAKQDEDSALSAPLAPRELRLSSAGVIRGKFVSLFLALFYPLSIYNIFLWVLYILHVIIGFI